jgi:cyclic pyranopterin phosphate synthase
MKDSYGRQIRDLRVSLTDRCNFRCFYCLPHGEPPLARKEKVLTYEEIESLCEIFVSLGIEKIRLTGGEPLLRKNVEVLIGKLAKLKPRLREIALTTNGYLLDAKRAGELKRAGLDRVTISLDSLRADRFAQITGVDALDKALKSIEAAKSAGLDPVKINAVVVRGRNDDEIVDLARFARENAVSMRFIEFMPLDSAHEWNKEMVVSGREIRDKIDAAFPLVLKQKSRGASTAWNFTFADGAAGEIGIIAPVTEMFCGACSRIRLTADGNIRTCLFSTTEYNLRDVFRAGASRAKIVEFIKSVVDKKEPRHLINDEKFAHASRSMSFIGG